MNDFERKLASMRPRQLREIVVPGKSYNKSRNLWLRAKRVMPYTAGFLAGVIVTYIAMSPPTPITKSETVVVTPILDDVAIAKLRRPMDLRQLASVRIAKESSVEPLPETEFQYRTFLIKEIERQRR